MWFHRDPYGRRRYPYHDRYYHDRSYVWTLLPLLQQANRLLTVAATPVTLALLALQVALHYRGALLPGLEAALPAFRLRDACILPARWWELRRLALAPLLHVDDVHLYYNMVSFISKGAALEPALGPERFGRLVAGLGLAAGAIHVALAFALRLLSPEVFADEVRGSQRGAARFPLAAGRLGPNRAPASAARSTPARWASAPCCLRSRWCPPGTRAAPAKWSSAFTCRCVLPRRCALRTLRSPRQHACPVFALTPPLSQMRWLCWGELLWIQLISPNVSFLGHLAGILAGILYIAPPRALRVEAARLRRQARRAWSAVAWAFSAPPPMQQPRQPAPPPPRGMPTAEELRALHVARFTRTQRPRGASPPPRRR